MIHSWRPQGALLVLETEAAQHVVFTFSNGRLFQNVVNYDRDETEGLTAEDLIGAISANYGAAETPPPVAETVRGQYGRSRQSINEDESRGTGK